MYNEIALARGQVSNVRTAEEESPDRSDESEEGEEEEEEEGAGEEGEWRVERARERAMRLRVSRSEKVVSSWMKVPTKPGHLGKRIK